MPHDEVVGETLLPHDQARGSRIGGEARPAHLVRSQRDGAHQADHRRLAHKRMLGQGPEPVLQIWPRLLACAVDQTFLVKDAQVLERHRAGDRVTGIGVAVIEFRAVDHRGDLVRQDRAADGLVSRTQPLGDGHDVGPDSHRLRAEPTARPPETADDLVCDQQDAVLVDDALDFGPIGLRRHDDAAGALHRFRDECGDVFGTKFEDSLLQLAGALQPEFLGARVAPFEIPVRLVDMGDAGDRHPPLRMHPLHPAKAARSNGGAMIGVPARDHPLPLRLALLRPVGAHETQVGVVRLGPRRGEEDMVQIARRQLRQLRGQPDRGHMRGLEKGIVKGQLGHLPVRGIGKLGPPVTDIDAPQSGHRVEDPVAVAVGEPAAFRPRDHAGALVPQARAMGKGMHVMRRVQSLQLGCRGVRGDIGHRGPLKCAHGRASGRTRQPLRIAGEGMIRSVAVNRVGAAEQPRLAQPHTLRQVVFRGPTGGRRVAAAQGVDQVLVAVGQALRPDLPAHHAQGLSPPVALAAPPAGSALRPAGLHGNMSSVLLNRNV